jgi:hypothetical protein
MVLFIITAVRISNPIHLWFLCFHICSKPSLIQLQLIWISDSLDRNMKNEKFCSQLSTYFKRHKGFRSKRTFRLCWGQLERLKPHKKNIHDWLELSGGEPGFQLLVFLQFLNRGSTVTIFSYLFSSVLLILLNFPFICFPSFFFRTVICFINPYYHLIRMSSPRN